MSSITRQTYFGPEDFPLLRAFLLRTGYFRDRCDGRPTGAGSAKQLAEIFREGRHDPGQMLDALITMRTMRLCGTHQLDSYRWEHERKLQNPDRAD